ncbi:hypothetical protein ACX0G7_18965 [Flavitalea antarctica]
MIAKARILQIILLLCLPTLLFAKVYKVSTAAEFAAAAEKVVPGDRIVIINGQYNGWQLVVIQMAKKEDPFLSRQRRQERWYSPVM